MSSQEESSKRTFEGTVHVLPYTHADIAWVHTRDWHLDRYTRDMDEVLEMFRTNPDYHYYVDTWIEFIKPYIDLRPESVEAIRKYIGEGRLTVCAGQFGNVRSTNIGNETFIRNMQIGTRHWRELAPDVDLKVHSNIDVTFGHTQMPQLLSLMGLISYFVMRPLAALDALDIPRAFHWQGLSGDTVIMYRDTGVGLFQEYERHGEHWDSDWEAAAQHIWNAYLSEPAADGTCNIALTVGIDDGRPERFAFNDTPARYDELIRVWNEREKSTMQYSSPNKLIEAIQAEGDKLRTVSDVLDPTDVSFNISVNGREGIWWLREQADRLIVQSEIVNALASLSGKDAIPSDDFIPTWEQYMSWTPHAVQWLFRQDWREGSLALNNVALDSRKRIGAAGKSLVGGCLPMDSQGMAVIGTVPGRQTEVIPLWVMNSDLSRDLARITDAQGRNVPFQVIDLPVGSAELNMLAELETPGCGYTTLNFEWDEAPGGISYTEAISQMEKKYGMPERKVLEQETYELASDRMKLTFKNGHIVSVEDTTTGMIRQAPEGASFLEPVCYPIENRTGWSSDAISDNPASFEVDQVRLDEAGPLRWRVTRTGKTGGFWIKQSIDLLKGESLVRSETQFLAPGDNSDAFITMSIPVTEDADFTADIPFGVEPRKVKEIQYGISERAIPGFFWGRTWANAFDGEGSVALVAADGDKFFRAYGEPRRLVHFMAQKTQIFDSKWELYIDTFNAGGRQVFNHILAMGDSADQQVKLVRLAEKLRRPFSTQYVPADVVGTEAEMVKVAPETVALSALYHEGDDLMLRLVQLAPDASDAEVTLPSAVESVELIDLLGNRMPGDVTVDGQSIKLKINPWQIATLKIRTK
ncbi:MAG: glycoside hydrolase family 38 N-terminal domain-containing protein [Armatimonadota bacterium]